MKIGNINKDKPLLLAPMESITDLPFRVICKRLGADIVYSEFIASEGLIRDARKSKEKLLVDEKERPVAIQIFGSNIESMVESAKIVEASGADILDINFGCWVRKVVNNNAGAAFLKNPELMAEMTHAVVNAVSIPVTVKTRLGWDKNSIVIIEAAKMLEQAGISAIAVHCRTRDMAMRGVADWSWIPKIKDVVSIPVILNGDVKTPTDAKKAFEVTGCDGVMVGRAAVGNPFIFKQTKELIEYGREPLDITLDEKIETCLEHLALNMEYKGETRGLKEFRKHYSGYLKGLYNSSSVRQKLVVMENYEEIKVTLLNYLNDLKNSNIPKVLELSEGV